jgi:hypothetical protein
MLAAARHAMHDITRGLGLGLIGGIAGLFAMRFAQRVVSPFVKDRAPKPMEIFATERSMSLVGPQHGIDEAANEALARIAYEKLLRREPSEAAKRRLAWLLHAGYGMVAAAIFGALRRSGRHAIRAGAVFGTALWLFGDELAIPLFGLSDKPTVYHPTRHLQALVAHLGYGIATAATTRALRDMT